MNVIRIKRITIHMFFSAVLLTAFTTPVFAMTIELANPEKQEAVNLNGPLALITPKPIHKNLEIMGPEKPEATPAPSPTPTSTPSSTSTDRPTPSPTITPEPTMTPTATPVPVQATLGSNTSTGGGLNADILFDMSNNYRAGLGLPPFQKDAMICALAASRAPEISAEISGGYMHAGKNNHNFPYWFTENIITMRTEAEAFNWWINDHIHRVQIEEANTHSCVACAGNACVQHFTSFKPK